MTFALLCISWGTGRTGDTGAFQQWTNIPSVHQHPQDFTSQEIQMYVAIMCKDVLYRSNVCFDIIDQKCFIIYIICLFVL